MIPCNVAERFQDWLVLVMHDDVYGQRLRRFKKYYLDDVGSLCSTLRVQHNSLVWPDCGGCLLMLAPIVQQILILNLITVLRYLVIF